MSANPQPPTRASTTTRICSLMEWACEEAMYNHMMNEALIIRDAMAHVLTSIEFSAEERGKTGPSLLERVRETESK